MMFPRSGGALALQCLVKQVQPEDLVLRLYVNDHEPEDADTAGSYTEARGYGYEPITLYGANWTILPGDPPSAVYGWKTFIFKGPLGSVYGFFITQAISGALVCAHRFEDGPDRIGALGGQIKVQPTITAG